MGVDGKDGSDGKYNPGIQVFCSCIEHSSIKRYAKGSSIEQYSVLITEHKEKKNTSIKH